MTAIAHDPQEPRLEEQPFAEQFALWAIRTWVAGLKTGSARSFALQRGFDMAGIPAGLTALDRLLGAIATGAARSIDVRCVPCKSVSPDERAILAALSAAQDNATDLAHSLLECLLVPSAAQAAARYTVALAGAMTEAGMTLVRRGSYQPWRPVVVTTGSDRTIH